MQPITHLPSPAGLLLAGVCLLALPAVSAAPERSMPPEKTARLKLSVKDDAGRPSPFRVEWWRPRVGRIGRAWSGSGSAEVEVPAGPLSVLVRRGIDHDAAALSLSLAAGAVETREVVLRRRFDAKAAGWWGGDNHIHVVHGRSDDQSLTIARGGEIAAGDGLDYVQLGYQWDSTGAWIPDKELERQCRAATDEHVVVGWNIEAPKAYMGPDDGGKSGNLHCYGHGWTVGLKSNARGREFFSTGPNFRVMQEVRRQGGIVGCAHPVRFWFNNGNFVSNWASELPFDFVAGVPYAAVDILNDSPLLFFQSEHLWYTLLNLGYKVAGTGNSDACLELGSPAGRFRTYTHMEGAFTWAKLAEGIQAGRNVATSGPFALWEIDGRMPGAEFPADGRPHETTLQAWSGPLPGDVLTAVQLVRNGEVVRAWDLRAEGLREWQTAFAVSDTEFAWYCVRVLSSTHDPQSLRQWGAQAQELAVVNPVYFLPAGFQRPRAAAASVTLTVTDAETGRPMAATVCVEDGAGEIARHPVGPSGIAAMAMPATASLRVEAPGHEPATRNLYKDCPELFDYCRNIGTVWPSFYSPETYEELRQRLRKLELAVSLRRKT